MNVRDGQRLWRADTTALKAVPVAVKSALQNLDTDGVHITQNTHFERQADAWRSLERMLSAHIYQAKAAHQDQEELYAGSGRTLENARNNFQIFIRNRTQVFY